MPYNANTPALRDDDALATLFAPVPEDQVTSLLARYAIDKDRCEQVAAVFSGDLLSVVPYFTEGNAPGLVAHVERSDRQRVRGHERERCFAAR